METDQERAERHERERLESHERHERERLESHERHERERTDQHDAPSGSDRTTTRF